MRLTYIFLPLTLFVFSLGCGRSPEPKEVPSLGETKTETQSRLEIEVRSIRSKEVPTFTYIRSMRGPLVFAGESLGFGLIELVEFTGRPALVMDYADSGGSGFQKLPQDQVSPQLMPLDISANWVSLKDTADGEYKPVYFGPDIVISSFPLHN